MRHFITPTVRYTTFEAGDAIFAFLSNRGTNLKTQDQMVANKGDAEMIKGWVPAGTRTIPIMDARTLWKQPPVRKGIRQQILVFSIVIGETEYTVGLLIDRILDSKRIPEEEMKENTRITIPGFVGLFTPPQKRPITILDRNAMFPEKYQKAIVNHFNEGQPSNSVGTR